MAPREPLHQALAVVAVARLGQQHRVCHELVGDGAEVLFRRLTRLLLDPERRRVRALPLGAVPALPLLLLLLLLLVMEWIPNN